MEDKEMEVELIEKGQKFCIAKVLIGFCKIMTSAEFLVYAIATVLFILYAPKDQFHFWIGYLALGGVFMFFKPLSSLIARGNLNVNAGISKNINVNK